MAKMFLAGLVAAVLAGAAVTTQTVQDGLTLQSAIGLPVISSNGEKVGQVTGVESAAHEAVLVCEIDRPLGIGSDTVEIPHGAFVRRDDHIELLFSAAELRGAIDRASRRRSTSRQHHV